MTSWNDRPTRKPSGGRIGSARKKMKMDRRSEPSLTRLGKEHTALFRCRGGAFKARLISAGRANVMDPSTGKTSVSKILEILENSADPHFVRRNLITKGAVINTEAGKARVTSRPSQDGTVNAVLIKG